MEIRNQSQTGPTAPLLAEITATLSRQIEDRKQPWLERLNQDPASFAHLEREIHDCFRHLADQMTASLLASATPAGQPTESEKKGGPAATPSDVPRRRGG